MSMARVVLAASMVHFMIEGVCGLQTSVRLGSRARMRTGARVSVALRRRAVRLPLSSDSSAGTALVHKTAFYGEMKVGTPGERFAVVFDTGSGNLLIPGDGCTSEACLVHRRFHPRNSSTSKRVSCSAESTVLDDNEEDDIGITFGTGEIWGSCYEDSICLGDICDPGSFIVTSFESHDPFKLFSFDGVLGLALPAMSQGPSFNLMGRLMSHRTLHDSLFTVFMSDDDDETSEVTFGDIKHEHRASEIIWSQVERDFGYWEVRMGDITLNNVEMGICKGCFVAVDTGTSELAGPPDVIDRLLVELSVTKDCSNFDSLPLLGFTVNGHVLNLEPRDYVEMDRGECSVALMPLDVPPPKGPLFVFGVPFLQRFYTIYDVANRRVGFAIANHNKTGSSSAGGGTLATDQETF